MQLSAETRHLLQKKVKRASHPLEIAGCSVLSTLIFALVYQCVCSEARYHGSAVVVVAVAAGCTTSLALMALAAMKYRGDKPSRFWIALALCVSVSFSAAYLLGERYWFQHLASYYTWGDMASYVNIDPFKDRGQSFMDAGAIYFKDGSYVLKNNAVAFRNGHTYCVAPIVRKVGNVSKQQAGGFEMDLGGSVDFWAVGVDCCGPKGEHFECGDTNSRIARSGLRELDTSSRPMYLLGVQEWSARTGLPVKHPLFFTWVKDPISHAEGVLTDSESAFIIRVGNCFFFSLIGAFAIHTFLQRLRVN